MTRPVVLPRSLDPLPDESLAGFLLRLSFRLGVPAGQIAALGGLVPGRCIMIPASRMLFLDDATTCVFAEATRLTPGEVKALTLAGLAGRYPPLGLSYLGRERKPGGLFIKENWVLSRSTRYCPQCLAGDPASPVQQRFGGAWNKLWRLPAVFACLAHQRLLEDTCPACGQPVHLRATHGGQVSVIPLPAHAAQHPAACRNPLPAGPCARNGRRQLRPCGHLLTQSGPVPPADPPDWLGHMLRFQQHLLRLLDPHGPAATTSAGEPASPGQYVNDLRVLACLIIASWPAARDLACPWQATLISQHAEEVRRQIDATRGTRRPDWQISFYDTPPAGPAACAALLTLAGDILAGATPGSLGQILSHLTDPAVISAILFLQRWVKWFLAGDGYCSPAFRAAAGPAVGARHVIAQTTARSSPRYLRPPPRPDARYTITHIPAYLPDEWYGQHIARFAGLAPQQMLRRAAAVRLARTCTPASYPRLGELLGIPALAAKEATSNVRHRLQAAGQLAEFDAAIDALASMLDSATTRIDYGRRRHALRNWVISPSRWSQLISGLPASSDPRTDWGDRKRMLASAWVWVRITGGERLFAPAVMADPAAPRNQRPGGRDRLLYINLRWPDLTAGTRGHYLPLRQRLDAYAGQIAAGIDNNPSTAT